MPRLLLIDDESAIRDLVADVAESAGYDVEAVATRDEFFTAFDRAPPDVAIIDLVLPGSDGVEVLRELAERDASAKLIVISGMDSKVLNTAERLGGQYGLRMVGAFTKPVDMATLTACLEALCPAETEITGQALAGAIQKGEIVAYFQPKMELHQSGGSRVSGAEALVRWNRPGIGLVPPDLFIPLIEEGDLAEPLTLEVVRQATALLARLPEAAGLLSVAVNLPPQLLHDLRLPDRIAAIAREAGVPPRRLVVEITERAAMSDGPTGMDILTRFRLKEIGLALDDFGVGYASLIDLYRMPFNELKIDRSFVADLETSDEARIIVRALIGLAHNLGLSVCAEGVESPAALAFLVDEGCDKAQGYLFAKPLPADEFVEFVESRSPANERIQTDRSAVVAFSK